MFESAHPTCNAIRMILYKQAYVGIMIAVRLPQLENVYADIVVSDVGRNTLFSKATVAKAN